jgi:putative nucleotidyltransferase with HDIG domain
MRYVSALLKDKTFLEILEEIEKLEEERVYCRHNFAHLMDVARLACMSNVKNGKVAEEEQIYLAALLHDIGRAEEYKNGISHAIAGKRLAGEILLRIGYPMDKSQQILNAIEEHRGKHDVLIQDEQCKQDEQSERVDLQRLIYNADKKSRACFLCKVADSCKWSTSQKNKAEDWR